MTYLALTIWDVPPHQSTETSRDAAISMSGKTANLRDLVLKELQLEALTDEQISERTGLAPNTARPRRVELLQRGLIEEVGKAVTRSGRKASLWRAV